MASLTERKDAARKAAFARRKVAHDARIGTAAHLSVFLAGHRGVPLAGYMAMRTEIDPTPAMEEASAHGPVGVPVIIGAGQALKFRIWEPGVEMIAGEFGGRLGYGGGFYDRTLEGLRAHQATLAIGFAYAAQQADSIPLEPTDQPLNLMITEIGQTSF
jgi:5-formyltetrahydrofolate cyclo-ligase